MVHYIRADDEEYEKEQHTSKLVGSVSFPVQNNNFLSRLRTADSSPYDWQLSCTDTAELVHQLTTWPRVYAEYQAEGLLPVDHHADERDSTTFCLEQKFNWTGSVHGPAQSTGSDKLPKVDSACQPEIERLVVAMKETNAVYLAVYGSTKLVSKALKCIPLQTLPVYVVSVDCRDVTSAGSPPTMKLGLNREASDRRRCVDEIKQRGWSLHAETLRDFVFVRRNDAFVDVTDHVLTER